MVKDGRLMGISAEVFHDGIGTAKRSFGVDDPVLSVALPPPSYYFLGLGRCARWSIQFTALPGFHKLPEVDGTEDLTHRPDGEEKTGLTAGYFGFNPLPDACMAGLTELPPQHLSDEANGFLPHNEVNHRRARR